MNQANQCNNCYSVAKVFTMTAIGMLHDRKLLRVDDLVGQYLRIPYYADSRWNNVTLEHLLTHRVGFLDKYWILTQKTRRHIVRMIIWKWFFHTGWVRIRGSVFSIPTPPTICSHEWFRLSVGNR